MMTTHNAQTRAADRLLGEKMCRRSMLQLLACVGAARTTLTVVLPLAGSAGWWAVPASLLPGAAVYAILALTMRSQKAETLTACARKLLGRTGEAAVRWLMTAFVLAEGVLNVTALVSLFTDGIGTEGTHRTLALLTLAALLFCLDRDGLPRAVYLLRWITRGMLAIIAVSSLSLASADRLFPILGSGADNVWTAIWRGAVMMGLPPLLLLTSEPTGRGNRATDLLPMVGVCAGIALVTALIMPGQMMQARRALAPSLLTPVMAHSSVVRLIAASLMMMTLFLSASGEAQLAGHWLTNAGNSAGKWSARVIGGLFCAAQFVDTGRIWSVFSKTNQILFLAVLAASIFLGLAALISYGRRKRCGA